MAKVPPPSLNTVLYSPTLYETLDTTLDGAITDRAGRIIAKPLNPNISSTETIAARGEQATINARISKGINAFGLPISNKWGAWYLRETRQRLRLRALSESTQLVVASIGDSWTHAATRFTGPLSSTLKTMFGDAGPGWTGFAWGFGGTSDVWSGGNGCVSTDITVTLTTGWTVAYYTSPGPDIGQIATATAGSKVSVAYSGSGNTSAVVFYYIAGAGSVRYRWNAGGWTTIDTSVGSGLTTATLAGMPTGTWTLEIENVSGTTTICGVDVQKSASGVRWHKLGSTGSASSLWAVVNATQWQNGIAALNPRLVIVSLGTNDQGAMTPEAYNTNMRTLIGRIKTAVPSADILIMMPCENGRANAFPMTRYSAYAYKIASDLKCAYLDLQYLFGDSYSEYAYGSARPWFAADTIHPDPTTGGRAIVDGLYRLMINEA